MRQLELNLIPSPELNGTVQPWMYRFTDKALIEGLGARQYVYGVWDTLFGCWEVDIRKVRNREIIPTWPPFDAMGIWRPPVDVRLELTHQRPWNLTPKWRYEANAAFAAYFSIIPSRIRALVAPMQAMQWVGLDLIWQVPEFAHFLDEEQFRGSQQFVYACLALAKAETLPRGKRRELALNIMQEKRHNTLALIRRRITPRKTVRALTRIGGNFLGREIYDAFFNLMETNDASKRIQHLSEIDPDGLRALSQVPRSLMTSRIASFALENPNHFQIIGSSTDQEQLADFRALLALAPTLPVSLQDRLRSSVNELRSSTELEQWGQKWMTRFGQELDFPMPPHKGNAKLLPLTSPGALRRESYVMRNCLSNMLASVLGGETYFYHWNWGEAATIMVTKQNTGQWKIAEARGVQNQDLGQSTLEDIHHEFYGSAKNSHARRSG